MSQTENVTDRKCHRHVIALPMFSSKVSEFERKLTQDKTPLGKHQDGH